MGYHQAGFEVVGVDIEPQKNYPFEFHQADAFEFLAEHGREFDAIHASPPCQSYTSLRSLHPEKEYPDLLDATRDALISLGLPYMIENVPGSPIRANLMLCGTMFRLGTPCGAELQRHRYFEAPWFSGFVPDCEHGWSLGGVIGVFGSKARDRSINREYSVRRTIGVVGHTANDQGAKHRRRRVMSVTGSTAQQNVVNNQIRETYSVAEARIAMGIPWMTMAELSQAIPPAYTKFIGERLMRELGDLK